MAEKIVGLTDKGRMRENNEDTFIAEQVLNNRFLIGCVIDGVGGYEGGEVAAAIARQAILDYISIPSGDLTTMLREGVVSANEKIFREKSRSGANERMACVLTAVILEKKTNKFFYAHVGDTRLYLFRDQSLVKVTKDHSFVGFLEDNGRLTEREAMAHPKRNEIDKALGFTEHISNPGEFVESGESPFLPGDILLICSDGLTDLVSRDMINVILASADPLSMKAQKLIDAANSAGGKDNITVVLIHHDTKPVKQSSKKPALPVKKNEELIETHVADSPTIPSKHSNKGWVGVLAALSILLSAALIWLWLNPNQNAIERRDATSTDTIPQADSSFQTLINSTRNDTLSISDHHPGTQVLIKDRLLFSQDSIYVMGGGKEWVGDSSKRATISVGPQVKKLVLDSLTLSNIVIEVSEQNAEALQFKNVRFRNVDMKVLVPVYFPDTAFTGSLRELPVTNNR